MQIILLNNSIVSSSQSLFREMKEILTLRKLPPKKIYNHSGQNFRPGKGFQPEGIMVK